MGWRDSLVRLADYEVEQLRVRLAEVVDRRVQAELELALLHAEAEAERHRADSDVEAGWYRLGYLEGWRIRRDRLHEHIAAIQAEEAGARDALARAFEDLKKYEHLREVAAGEARQEAARLDVAAMDELGARRAAAR